MELHSNTSVDVTLTPVPVFPHLIEPRVLKCIHTQSWRQSGEQVPLWCHANAVTITYLIYDVI